MGKGKQKPLVANKQYEDGDELAGSTLEDYFASHKVSGLVSQHLLNIPTDDNNVMAAEKAEECQIHAESFESMSEQGSYEDDYEVDETGISNFDFVQEVAGMSLCDYLCVKDDDRAAAKETMAVTESQQVFESQPTLETDANLNLNGMSLDYYFGSTKHLEENRHGARAKKKFSPKVKHKGSKAKQTTAVLPEGKSSLSVKGSGSIQALDNVRKPMVNPDETNESADDLISNGLTPFQRRQKRKNQAKSKLQRNVGNKSLNSKAFLVSEVLNESEKRKGILNASHRLHHHVPHSLAANHQSPLPKLALSPSFLYTSQKDHDIDDEKLPLL
ncbi:uncharacterized protein PHALS_02058 [Plasmopara halstedii]|uniref:Uncharacterized protein n=1 Tax=Plasmopara halstedii TaxID=4781 RepID=A0A0P1AX81_PLAHL|nr:uncharacterized protein PHALS_02058 [Plasmopara halstedii]CEG45786.1 hypothetical protein PHALS_02058 [Plasmopara halstedii]|eukprot:XP_024582155.1 hypothetical protein PHALS_02058 [Plasmopara halstedii]